MFRKEGMHTQRRHRRRRYCILAREEDENIAAAATQEQHGRRHATHIRAHCIQFLFLYFPPLSACVLLLYSNSYCCFNHFVCLSVFLSYLFYFRSLSLFIIITIIIIVVVLVEICMPICLCVCVAALLIFFCS